MLITVFILLVDELDKAHAKDVGVKHGSCIQERVEANPPPPPSSPKSRRQAGGRGRCRVVSRRPRFQVRGVTIHYRQWRTLVRWMVLSEASDRAATF